MTVYITTLFDGDYNTTYTFGAFSTLQKALDAFNYFMSNYYLELIDKLDGSILTTRTYVDKEDPAIKYHLEVRKAVIDTII